MSDAQPAEAVKLITSLFSGDAGLLDGTIRALSAKYGQADFVSALVPFDYTSYYSKEFGGSLMRRFVSFEKLVRPESLPDIKRWTNDLEKSLSEEGRRRVNIDPGYLAKAHLILATAKGYTHRPYLRDGVYADLTLIYQDKGFRTLPWTYPDYASAEVIGMLGRIRERYIVQLKEMARGNGRESVKILFLQDK